MGAALLHPPPCWAAAGMLLAILAASHAAAPAAAAAPPSPPPAIRPLAPEPGMLPLPYLRSYFYPGPSPTSLTQPFNLSLPPPPMAWFREADSGTYRTTQDRHVFGPFPTLPAALLLQGKIAMAGATGDKGTQGALYVHQVLYYQGGAEMGWVYFNANQRVATYLATDANLPTQKWQSNYSADSAFMGRALSFRMAWDTGARYTSSKVYSSSGVLYDLSTRWPSWMAYNKNLPWYITVTWQRNDNSTTQGLLSGASLWYLPGAPSPPAAPPQPLGAKGLDYPPPPDAPEAPQAPPPPPGGIVSLPGGDLAPASTWGGTPAPAPEPDAPANHALGIGLGIGVGCVALAALAAAAVFTFKRARGGPAKPGVPPVLEAGPPGRQAVHPTLEPAATSVSHMNPVFDAADAADDATGPSGDDAGGAAVEGQKVRGEPGLA